MQLRSRSRVAQKASVLPTPSPPDAAALASASSISSEGAELTTPEPTRKRQKLAPQATPSTPGRRAIDGCLDSVASLQRACDALVRADPSLAPLVAEHGLPTRLLAKGGSSFATLAKSICYQQLATAAAAAIYGRVLAACGCAEVLTPAAMLAAPQAELRAAGLSERKVSYLRDLATHYESGHLTDALVYSWDDRTLHAELTKVKGIGDWSVDMFAMCHLGHPDVLPVGDLGVRRGLQAHFKLRELPLPADMERFTAHWAPFRSVGCWYMWRVLEPTTRKPTDKSKNK